MSDTNEEKALSVEQKRQNMTRAVAELMAGQWSDEIADGLYYRMMDLIEARPTSGYASHDHFTASLIALGDYCKLMAKIRLNRDRSLDNKRPET